jgi:hypothetical protein
VNASLAATVTPVVVRSAPERKACRGRADQDVGRAAEKPVGKDGGTVAGVDDEQRGGVMAVPGGPQAAQHVPDLIDDLSWWQIDLSRRNGSGLCSARVQVVQCRLQVGAWRPLEPSPPMRTGRSGSTLVASAAELK